MRQSFYLLGALTLALSLGGCGTTIRPHVGRGGTDQPSGILPGGRVSPRPDPDPGVEDPAHPVIDQVCRAQAMRSGWIATRYLRAEDCPESTDPGNPYTAAVIERYSHQPVGATMVVCADQPIPRQWVREYNQDARATCQGARVRDGAPTVMMIRRVSARS